jgi:hypothetical protein
MRIAILGGTGNEGRGLALRWGRGGVEVALGSRDPERARRVADQLNQRLGQVMVQGHSHREAVERSQLVVSTLPHPGGLDILEAVRDGLAGKALLVATVIWPPTAVDRPSAAEMIQERLARSASVAAAFQTVSAHTLSAIDEQIEEHVLVCSDEPRTRSEAVAAIARAGLRAVDVGPLRQARILEALTGLLLQVNKNYRVKATGIRITGLPSP